MAGRPADSAADSWTSTSIRSPSRRIIPKPYGPSDGAPARVRWIRSRTAARSSGATSEAMEEKPRRSCSEYPRRSVSLGLA